MGQTTVNVAELRRHLSAYLNRARKGEEILIRDRNLPVAKLVPLSTAKDFEEGLLELAAQGLVKLPEKRWDFKTFLCTRVPEVPIAKLRAAIEADREES